MVNDPGKLASLLLSLLIVQAVQPNEASCQAINLDLRSTTRDTTSGAISSGGSVFIRVGNSVRQVNQTTPLTPAEKLAVWQVVSTGTQNLVLSSAGDAVAGRFQMGVNFSNYASSLAVPSGVTALRDSGRSGNLNLTGTLTNSGSVFLYSTDANVRTALISAQNIFNERTGIISTILPTELRSALGPNVSSSLNLSLVASDSIINSGIISSSAGLTVTAGDTIQNITTGGSMAAMQAASDLALSAGSGNYVNTGMIASSNGTSILAHRSFKT